MRSIGTIRLALLCASTVVVVEGSARAACQTLDPADIAAFAKRAAADAAKAKPQPPVPTTQDLEKELRKSRLPEQADRVASLPGTVEEWSFDFLDGGVYVKATLDGPVRTEVLQFVRQKGHLIPIGRGRAGRERIANDVHVSIRGANVALRYVQWLLEVTGEGVWLVSSPDDVPLLSPRRDNLDLKAKVDGARQELASKVTPPGAADSGTVFTVHQDAVAGRDLVRYTVKVSRLGLPTVGEEKIVGDLPVVALIAPQ